MSRAGVTQSTVNSGATHSRLTSIRLSGDTSVADVGTDLVLAVLQQSVKVDALKDAPLWIVRTETCSRVRGRIEAILSWAKARNFRTGENPAAWRGHLDKLLPRPSKVRRVVHHPALPYVEMPEFMSDLRLREGSSLRALEFAVLTAARTSEVLEPNSMSSTLDPRSGSCLGNA